MENNGFCSPRTDAFPAGLRVLVVDDDPTWIKILEKMLIKCSYEVTTCCLARDALNMLRERKNGFDIVISDVNMPDMDGFKLLEHVGLEMDLPVIMMSVDGETSRVMKGVQHGACDYLLKPIRMKELRNIWQHVLRKKILEVKDIENQEAGSEDTHKMRYGLDEFDSCLSINGVDVSSGRKRKDMENQEHDDQDFNDSSSAKKARVVWSVDLHQKFVKAVNQIGFDKVGPKKILDLMNVPWLTRENVASHLQKYRLYLSRLQKQNDPKASFGAIKQSDFTSKDSVTSFGFQSSTTILQDSPVSCSFGISSNKMLIQDVGPKFIEGDLNGIGSFLPITNTEKKFRDDTADLHQASISSQMGITHSFGSFVQDINYTSIGSTVTQQIAWDREIPTVQLITQSKKECEPCQFSNVTLPASQHHIQVDQLHSAPFINTRTSITERDRERPCKIKHLSSDYRSNHVRSVTPAECTGDSPSVLLPMSDIIYPQPSRSMFTRIPSMKSHSFDQIINNLEPQRGFNMVSGSTLISSHEDLQHCSLHDYGCIENAELSSRETLNYSIPDPIITELPSTLYDVMRFNSDYPSDTLDYPIIDQGLSIHSMIH